MQEISIFDLFSIGIGPSSSHTVGPMKAAYEFQRSIIDLGCLQTLERINIELFGSLAFTGKGHGTDKAIVLGLAGELPDRVRTSHINSFMEELSDTQTLKISNKHPISFELDTHIIYELDSLLPKHNNGMRFSAFDKSGQLILLDIFYSIGGGFVLHDGDRESEETSDVKLPYPFETAKELTQQCKANTLTISEVMLANEKIWQEETTVRQGILNIIDVMQTSIKNSCNSTGILPGGLNVKRRAALIHERLSKNGMPESHEATASLDWLNLYAIAVNEANAAGDRVVTAPTNGAAGIIPAVLTYYQNFYPGATEDKLIEFIMTAGAIALLYKKRASISGAEVGCQGEVGVACSMAAGALTAVLGGTLEQVQNAAEIAMEHHLGMTCDPIGGLVQIPCIERNAMGAVKAVNSARLALMGDGTHFVSLDDVIKTMKQTGEDMHHTYKETSKAGLAVNVVEC